MQPFTTLTGVAAPLLRDNIDTDVIIRVERLTGTSRESMGAVAFEAWRFRPDGSENPEFALNEARYRGAPILLAGANFGCGSSREGAVWAMMGMGLRCVIAESFGDIFFNNCFQNGLLPVRLPGETVRHLAEAEGAVTVDLIAQEVVGADGTRAAFEIEPMRRTALLEGLDEIGLTLKHQDAITRFQQADRSERPWVWLASEAPP
ncbi:MAG: 3-isopropylmalate dehydratase small subunit [Acetobacteraceae bacterium]|nr:3-isopropylmalate dehydratase small subunit [Acetobacteraceae bacterium]